MRRRFDSAIEVVFAATQVVTLCQKSAVVVIEKSIVISPGLIHLQPFLVGLLGTIQVSYDFEVQG